MDSLEEKLEEASLKGHDDVTAVITDVEIEERFTDNIVVHYRIGSGSGKTIESADHFEVPEENVPEFEFVRFCRELGVNLPAAHEELVGKTVSVESDGDRWSLNALDSKKGDGSASDSGQSPPGRLKGFASTDKPLVYAGYITLVLLFPLFALPVGYDTYRDKRDDGSAEAFAIGALTAGVGTALWLSALRVGFWVL